MSNGTGNPWDVDPLLCCAARVCCRSAQSARDATKRILSERLSMDDQYAGYLADAMEREGLVFLPQKVADMFRAFRDVKHEDEA